MNVGSVSWLQMPQSRGACWNWLRTHTSLLNNHRWLYVVQTHKTLLPKEQPLSSPLTLEGVRPSPPIHAKSSAKSQCQVEYPRQSSWYALYARYVGLFYGDRNSHPLNMPVTPCHGHAVGKEAPFTWRLYNPIIAKPSNRPGSLTGVSFLLRGLPDANKNARLINKRTGRGWRDSQETPIKWKFLNCCKEKRWIKQNLIGMKKRGNRKGRVVRLVPSGY